jgi:hypothetical protein
MDMSLFVASPIYAFVGLAIIALFVREVVRARLATRRRQRRHRGHHHSHRNAA